MRVNERTAETTTKKQELTGEVTRRKQAEAAVREADQKYRTIFNSNSTGIAITTLDGKVVDANQTYQDMVGYTLRELEGTNVQELTPKKWHKVEAAVIRHLMSEGYGTFEKEYIRKDGTIFPISVSAWLIRDRQGNPAGIGAFVTDVTKPRQAEEELRESAEKYRLIAENTTDVAFIQDMDLNITYTSPSVKALFGYTPEEVMNLYMRDYMTAESYERAMKTFRKYVARAEGKGEIDIPLMQYEYVRKDGSTFWGELKVTFLHDSKGRLIGSQGVLRDITERKKVEETLRETDSRYRALFDRTLYCVYVHDFEGRFLDANDAALNLLGYTREEIPSLSIYSLLGKDQLPTALKAIEEIKQIGRQKGITEFSLTTKDGNYVWVETEGSLIYQDGKPYGIQGIARDITGRKQAEEKLHTSEEKYRNLFQSSPKAIVLISLDGTVLEVNDTAETIAQLSREEVIGKHFTELGLFNEKDLQKFGELLPRFASGESVQPHKVQLTEGRKTRWLEVFPGLLKKNDKPYAIQVIARDITKQKLAEEEIESERDKLQALVDGLTGTGIGIDIVGIDYKVLYQNRFLQDRFGDTTGRLCYEAYMGLKKPCDICPMRKAVTSGSVENVELTGVDGKTYELISAPIPNPDGTVDKAIEVILDITERKQAEEALEESEEKYRTQFEQALDAIFLADTETGILVDCNREACKLVGRKKSELIGQHQRILHPRRKTNGEVTRTFKQHLGEKEGKILETQVITKKGEIKEVSIKATVIELRGKKLLQGIFRDVTDRKRREIELREAKTRFEDLFENANELIITTDAEGWILQLNKEVERLSGYSKKELIGKSILEIAYPEDRDKYIQFWKDILSGLTPRYELRTISKTGNVRHLLSSGNAIRKGGKVIEIEYNAKDITEQKQAEEKLRESEKKYRTILESVAEGYYEIDLAGNLTFFNNSLCQTLGYTRDKLIGMNNRDYMDEENARKVYQVFNEVYRTGKPRTGAQWEIIRKDGTKLSVSSSVSLITNKKGQSTGFRGLLQDITEQMKAEEALRQSEKKYRTILENVVEGYFEVDLAGNFTFVNDSICNNLGYTRDELIGMNNRDYMDKQTAKKVLERFAEVYTTGQPARGFEFEIIRKDGTKVVISSSVSLITDEKGEPTGFRGVVRDTTEEKKAEEKLQKSEEQYRSLFETATDGIFTMDLQTRFTSGNRKAEEMCGYSRDELMGKYATVILPEEEIPRMADAFKKVLKGETDTYETRIITKNGELLPVEVTSSPIEIDGKIIGTMGMARDITERKQVQEKLQQERDRFFSIFNSISQYVIVENQNHTIQFMNRRAIKDFGNLTGKTCYKELGRTSQCSACPLKSVIKKKEPAHYEIQAFERVLLGTGTPLANPDGSTSMLEVFSDITERKQAEEELRKSEEKYRQLTEEINDAIYTVDQDGNVTYISPVIEWFLGYSPSEITGRSFAEFMHEEDLPHGIEGFEHTLSGRSTEAEYRFHTKSGEIRWMGTSNRPIFDGERVVGARGTITDITNRKLAEQASREATSRFEDLFENANELIITTDEEGWVLHVNKEVERLTGYSREELIGQSILNIAYPEDTPKYIQFWKDILSGLNPHYQLRGVTKTGNIRHLLASGSTVIKDGEIVEIQYNAKDITDEKQAEEKLHESEKKYRTILESMTDGYYEVDLAGNFGFFNNSLCHIMGYTRGEIMGTNYRRYGNRDTTRKILQTFNRVYVTGKPVTGFEFEVIKKDGTKGFIEASASLIRDSKGRPAGFRGIVRDIAERKQMEKEKEELEQKAQLASRLSVVGEMASGIVHEINNPLTTVIGFAEILSHSKLPEDTREYATIINNEGKRVASIASRLLNFARHQKPQAEYTDINKLIQATLDLQSYEMTTGNIKVTTQLDPHLPQTMADPGQLQQVFLNIMLNARTAMRAAHGGGRFSVETQALDDTIRISLKDDGPGIPKENLKRIFNPFFTTRKAGEGTGLGLSICQGIINSHDGKIYAESTLGKGATFIIELPVVSRPRKTRRNARPNPNNVWR